jgi:glutamate-1-semialdehyde aminotransferase
MTAADTGTRSFSRSIALQEQLHAMVPGGAHTYARGSDQYPEDMAPVIALGRGAHVRDVDGNWFIEYGMGLRSVTLGHGYEPVVEAVAAAARGGVSFTRPSLLEVHAAEVEPGFLEGLRALADRDGFVLVFDEMITGMRWAAGGAQAVYGVTPDLSTWGKALGNGFPVSAPAGRRDLMEIGGLRTEASRAFLLSTTHGAETTGLAAYLAVAETYRRRDVVGEMEEVGLQLADAVSAVAAELSLGEHVAVVGRPSCLVFVTRDHEGRPSQEFRTLFLQEMLERGVLGQSFVVSAAHTEDDVDLTVSAARNVLKVYAQALDAGDTGGLLRGQPVAPAVRELAAPRRLPDIPTH